MERKRSCRHCHRLFIPVRNPQQQFCSHRLCQNVRKSIWRREKHKQDTDYRENQNQACKRWRQKNPHYWKSYRAAHPSYPSKASQFANSDALTPKNPVKTGTYQLIPLPDGGFANSDALIVTISVVSSDYQQMGDVCKHTTL